MATCSRASCTPSVPATVIHIIFNELCERFAFYGARAVLTLYFTTSLGYSEATAVSLYSWYLAACYVSPLLGGWVADTLWGKYRTILAFNAAYLAGLLVLSCTAFVDSAPGCFVGLLLMALGTGGIKPNISPFGVDNMLRSTEEQRTAYFFAFYMSVNVGSTLSYIFTPIVRAAGGFAWAFMLSFFMLALSVAVLLAAHHKYVLVPAAGSSVYAAVYRVMRAALLRGRGRSSVGAGPLSSAQLSEAQPLIDGSAAKTGTIATATAAPDAAVTGRASPYGTNEPASQLVPVFAAPVSKVSSEKQPLTAALRDERTCIDGARGHVDEQEFVDVRAVVRLLPLFLMLPVFWALFDSQGSVWTLQRTHMDNCIGPVDASWRQCLTPEQLGALNPIFVVILVPIFTRYLFPALRALPWRWTHPTPLRRMCVGMQLAAASFVLSALVQREVDSAPDGTVSALLQIPQLVIITAAELLVSTTGLEFVYSQAPASMKGSILAMFYLAISLGNVLTGVLYSSLSSVLSSLQLILLLAALMVVAGLIFILLAWRYTPVPPQPETAVEEEVVVVVPRVPEGDAAAPRRDS